MKSEERKCESEFFTRVKSGKGTKSVDRSNFHKSKKTGSVRNQVNKHRNKGGLALGSKLLIYKVINKTEFFQTVQYS